MLPVGKGRIRSSRNCPNRLKTIMDILLEGDPNHVRRRGATMNLIEILHDDLLEFQSKIDDRNLARANGEGGLLIDEVAGSPALRRGVNQALRIVEEIARMSGFWRTLRDAWLIGDKNSTI